MAHSKNTWRLAVLAACVTAALILVGQLRDPVAGADDVAPPYLLALGASESVGVQPTALHPHGERTDEGYANVLTRLEERRWPGLALVQLGCPGATTSTMLHGAGRCLYGEGTQLAEALRFLHTHPSSVLVTVDLGFNDLLPCLRGHAVDPSCVETQVTVVHAQLLATLRALRAAAPAGASIVGVGHYDPYLGDYLNGVTGQSFASATLSTFQRLDQVLRSTYAEEGVTMADVAHAFAMGDGPTRDASAAGQAPPDVRRVCALTWMCARPPYGPNLHPNDTGYAVIADTLARAIDSALGPPNSG